MSRDDRPQEFSAASATASADPFSRGHLTFDFALGMAVTMAGGLAARMWIAPIHPASVALVLAGVAFLLSTPALSRRGVQLHTINVSIVVLGSVIVFGTGWLAGAITSPILDCAVVIPFLAVLLLGTRSGMITVAVLSACVIAIYLLPRFGVHPPPSPIAGESLASARVVILVMALVLATLFATLFERRRNEADNLTRLVFQQSKDVVAVTTPDGQLAEINPAGLRLYGFSSRDEMASFDVRKLYLDAGDREELLAQLEQNDFVSGFESAHQSVDGTPIFVQGTTSCIRDRDGRLAYLLTILRDVTEQRRAAEEREDLIRQLAERNEELDRFTRTVSHDLRSPLVTVKGFLHFLRKDVAKGDRAKIERDLENMQQSIEKMDRLIEDLLKLAQLDREQIERETIDSGALVREAAELVSGRLTAADIELDVSPDLPEVVGVRPQLRAVFQNLIDNAAKAVTGRTAPRIEIDAQLQDEETTFRVTDNGAGVAPKDRERIFNLFEQVDAEQGGSGIGLAIVKRVIEIHGGRIWIESEGLDRGASVCFTIASSDP